MNPLPSALDHSNEGDEPPGSAFIKSNEHRLGHSPLHANILKRNCNMGGTLGGMQLNNHIVNTGTIGRHHDWLAESPKNAGHGRSGTNHMLPMYEGASSNEAKDASNGRSKNDYLT